MSYFGKIYSSWREIQWEKYEVVYKLIKKYEIDPGLSLDIGCGPFYLQEFFEEKGLDVEFVCIDIDESLKTTKYDFLIADGNLLPFKGEVFDSVFVIDSVHFIVEFSGIYKVLKLNGYVFVLTFVNDYNYSIKSAEVNEKLKDFKIIESFLSRGRETELVTLARKTF